MGLPQRVFYPVHEIATRWGCSVSDVAGWATMGQLRIVTGIPPVECGEWRAGGLVQVEPMDILPMFRSCGTGPREVRLYRVRPIESDEWLYITAPADGVRVSICSATIWMRKSASIWMRILARDRLRMAGYSVAGKRLFADDCRGASIFFRVGRWRLPRRTPRALGLFRSFPPVAFDIHLEDGRVMNKAVDGGQGHGRVREDRVPCAEGLVGRDQQDRKSVV